IPYRARSIKVAATIMCAVLYAIGAYLTAYIPSPWGFGQFRPAVFVPSFFAAIFGPMPAATGAAIGTLIADSYKHGYLYPGSLLAAVPGNFIGFYLFGYLLRKRFSWGRFVFATNLTLTLANAIVAFLYVFLFKVLYLSDPKYVQMSSEVLVYISTGLTIWWFVTMLPFVLLITPLLIRAVAAAFPSVVPEEVRASSLREELPKATFSLALIVPGSIMIVLGLATTYTLLASYTPLGAQIMFYASGIILAVLGVLVHTGQRTLWRKFNP
ncbi:MAG: hypothetical protein QW057_09720, partial [Candidatus Bathyarchaeia archaeon]